MTGAGVWQGRAERAIELAITNLNMDVFAKDAKYIIKSIVTTSSGFISLDVVTIGHAAVQ